MERNNGKPSPWGKAIETSIERILQCVEFVVNSYPQCLEYSRCCLYPTLPPSCYNKLRLKALIDLYLYSVNLCLISLTNTIKHGSKYQPKPICIGQHVPVLVDTELIPLRNTIKSRYISELPSHANFRLKPRRVTGTESVRTRLNRYYLLSCISVQKTDVQ